jgi:CelD/BcsL family acetyltransferase involved in cellulose biosynthesis
LRFAPGRSLNNYLSSNTRSAVAKARNRIKREGVVMTKNWSRDFEQIQATLGQVLDIYRRRDHQMFGQSLIDDPEAERFFLMFVTEHAKQNLIDLLTIHLDGQLAAFAVCLLDNDEHWVLVNKASPAWLRFSPGTIANAEVVAHAFEAADSHGVNWGGAPQRYKLSGEVTLIPRQTLFLWSSWRVKLLLNICRNWTRLSKKCTFFAKRLLNEKLL